MNNEVKRYFVDCNSLRGVNEPIDDCDVRVVLASDYDALLAETETLRKDAERYQWIRESGLPDAAIVEMDSYYDTLKLAQGEKLDRAIDKSMQKS